MLPDHPQLAPDSKGDLFDGTEIEEALLLHVHALSEGEREAIAQQDPAVREMIDARRGHDARGPHAPARAVMHADARATSRRTAGEAEIEVDGRDVPARRQGGAAPDPGATCTTRMLRRPPGHGGAHLRGLDDRVHLGVTVDDDPGRDVMRTSGRYTFFKPDEVELQVSDRRGRSWWPAWATPG